MSKADAKYIEMCKTVLHSGVSTKGEKVRARWADGTPAYTMKKFGVVNTYDLSEEFPAITLRKTYIKSAIDEILWIYQKKSNNIAELNSRVWDAWATPSTERRIIEVHPITKEKYDKLPDIKVSGIKRKYNEKEVRRSSYGDYIVLEKKGNRRVVQFLQTGFVNEVSSSQVSENNVKDYYARSIVGVGYLGDYKAKEIIEYFREYHARWKRTWKDMIRRANGHYSGPSANYENVFVDAPFHCCETFLRWVMENNPYKEKEMLGVLQIDKDYYGSNCYSPDTCTLLTPAQNTRLNCKNWYILDGKVYYGSQDLANFLCSDYLKTKKPSGFYDDRFMKHLIEGLKRNGEIKIIPLKNEDGSLNRFPITPAYTIGKAYGYQVGQKYAHHKAEHENLKMYPSAEIKKVNDEDWCFLDQIDAVLYDLKHNPHSRRIMTNLYAFHDLHEMGLYPCAYSMTFGVENGKLNGILNQRSQDILTAGNWNVVQYAALLMMIAQVSNLKPGVLTHVIGDAHIYDKHIPIIEELIQRKTFPAPKVTLNPEIKNFYDFTASDFVVEDYKAGEQVKNIPIAE